MAQHSCKEFNKIMCFIEKHDDFTTERLSRKKSTIKITYVPEKATMTTHVGDKAYHPIRRFLKKFKIIV